MAPIVASRTISSFDAFFASSAVLYTLKALAMMMVIILIGYIALRIRKWRAGRRSIDVESAIPSRTILSIPHIPQNLRTIKHVLRLPKVFGPTNVESAIPTSRTILSIPHIPRNLGSIKHVLGLPKVIAVNVVTYNLDIPPRGNITPVECRIRPTPLLRFTQVISSSKAPKFIAADVDTITTLSIDTKVASPQEATCAPLDGDIADCHLDGSIPSSSQLLSSSPAMECQTSSEPSILQNSDIAEVTADEDDTQFRLETFFEHQDQGLFSSLPSSESSWSIYHQSISTIAQSSLRGDTTDEDEGKDEHPFRFDADGVSSSSLPSLASSWSIHDRYTPTVTFTTPATPRKSIPRLVVIPPTPPRYPTSIPDIIVTPSTPPRRKAAASAKCFSGTPRRKSGKENKSLEMMSSTKRAGEDVRRVAFTQFKSGNYF